MKKILFICTLLACTGALAQQAIPIFKVDTIKARTNSIKMKDSTIFNSFVQMQFMSFAPTEVAGYGDIYVKSDSTINWRTLGYTHNLDSVTLAASLSGTGVGVYKSRSGVTEQFKRFVNDYGTIPTDYTDSIGIKIDTTKIATRATSFKWSVSGSTPQQDSLRHIPGGGIAESQSGHTITTTVDSTQFPATDYDVSLKKDKSDSTVGTGYETRNDLRNVWAGSTNITTLGTIGTGTWQGTSIDTAFTNAVSNVKGLLPVSVATFGKTKVISVDTNSILATKTDVLGNKVIKNVQIAGSTPNVNNVDSLQFNATNFQATNPSNQRFIVNTIQDISTGASPSFNNLFITGDETIDGIFTSTGTYTNSLPYWDGLGIMQNLSNVASGQVLTSQGTSTIPAWSATPTVTGLSLSGLTSGSVPFIGTGGRFRENNPVFQFDSTNAKLKMNKTVTVAGGAENNEDANFNFVGNTVEANYATYGGAALTARTKVGNGGVSSVGTYNSVIGHIKTFQSGNDSNETGAGYFDNSMDTNYAGTQWGLDVVTQNGKVQPNFMVGISSLVNNFYNGSSKRGMYGLSVVSRPVATGDNSAQYSGRTTYKIDALAAIGGWAGASYGARTSVAKDALRIGGLVSNWQGQTELSAVDTAVNIRDYSTAGIYIHDPFVANTPSILVGANGGVAGFGLTNPSSRNIVDIYRSDTNSTGTTIGANIVVENAPTAASSAIMRGISTVPQVQSANANNVSRMDGIRSAPTHAGTGTVTDAYGGLFVPTKSSTGVITNAYGGFFRVDNTNATNAIGTGYGVFIANFTVTGTISTQWGLYQQGSGQSNYFAGNTSIGSTTTTSQFNVGSSAQFQVNSSGAHVKVNNITVPATEHWQYAPYCDTVMKGGQTATIAAVNLNNTSTNGLYRVSVYMYTTTAGTSGTATATISWNDGSAQSVTSATLTFGTLGSEVTINGQMVRVTNSTAITYSTTITSAVGSPVYEIDVLAERIF